MNDDAPDLETVDVSGAEHWPPGWYADGWVPGAYRYWDGRAWTDETRRWGPRTPGGAPPEPPPGPTRLGPPSRPRGAVIAGVVAVVVLMVAAGAIGYRINEGSSSKPAARPAAPTAPPTTAPVSSDPDRGVLPGLVVRQRDVGAGRPVLLAPDGNTTGEATLDLCNGTYPSERLRTARLQVIEGAGGSGVFSTEAVLYRNAAATDQAFAELRHVTAACPRSPVVSPLQPPEPTVTTTFRPPPDRGWPQTPKVERLAYSFTTSDGSTTVPSIAVYLRHGRALLGLYFYRTTGAQPPVDGRTTIEGIVSLFAHRMAVLPDSVADASR